MEEIVFNGYLENIQKILELLKQYARNVLLKQNGKNIE